MIIRWCNHDPTITDSESSTSSSNNNETQNGTSSISNSSLSSYETDLNLSKTKRMDRKQKKRHKKKKDKEKKKKTRPLPEVVENDTSKNSTNNINKEKVNDNLITFNDSIINSSTDLDNGIPLDKFQNELLQSSHQYLPTFND